MNEEALGGGGAVAPKKTLQDVLDKKNCKDVTILKKYLFFMNIVSFIRHTLNGQQQ